MQRIATHGNVLQGIHSNVLRCRDRAPESAVAFGSVALLLLDHGAEYSPWAGLHSVARLLQRGAALVRQVVEDVVVLESGAASVLVPARRRNVLAPTSRRSPARPPAPHARTRAHARALTHTTPFAGAWRVPPAPHAE